MTADAAFTWPVRVYYEDTDAGGVVYYANYLRFMERARTEWLRTLGIEQDDLREREGLLFVVRSVSIEYLRSARLDDVLEVTVELAALGRASLVVRQEIFRRDGERCGELLSKGEVRIVCIHAASGTPRPIPKHIKEVLPRVR